MIVTTTRAPEGAVRLRRATGRPPTRLGDYRDQSGQARELVCLPALEGSVLVIDQISGLGTDRRLVAHLGADEPPANATLVSRHYLEDRRRRPQQPRPRFLEESDLRSVPFSDLCADRALLPDLRLEPGVSCSLVDPHGRRLRIEAVASATMAIPELRWLCLPPAGALGPPSVVSVREVVARLQDYEPARALTAALVDAHRHDPELSVALLRAELARVAASRIVLNRRLREAVLEATMRHGLSMSQIAVRCGRVKRDARGNLSGETSWLARRLGILPEGGERTPTPWIHSEVLALIARHGLGLAPQEVELG